MRDTQFDISQFEDPSPSPVNPATEELIPTTPPFENGSETKPPTRRARKRKLPFRADITVDGKRYRGKRISRGEADLDVESLGLLEDKKQDHDENLAEGLSSDGSEDGVGGGDDVAIGGQEGEGDETEDSDQAGERDEELVEEERAAAARLARAEERDHMRAAVVKKQKNTYDAAVDLRIRIEPLVSLARRFPTEKQRVDSDSWQGNEEINAARTNALKTLTTLLKELDTSFDVSWPHGQEYTEEEFDKWRNEILDHWGKKINQATGKEPKEGFKTIDTSVSAHMNAALISGKHLKKSRRVTQAFELFGGIEMADGLDDQYYDDGDLYRALLREIIESGEGEGGGLRYAQLSKGGKVKKKRDRLLAKGKRLKYDVHEKLIGFLTPLPLPDPGPLAEIVAAMFGRRGTVKALE